MHYFVFDPSDIYASAAVTLIRHYFEDFNRRSLLLVREGFKPAAYGNNARIKLITPEAILQEIRMSKAFRETMKASESQGGVEKNQVILFDPKFIRSDLREIADFFESMIMIDPARRYYGTGERPSSAAYVAPTRDGQPAESSVIGLTANLLGKSFSELPLIHRLLAIHDSKDRRYKGQFDDAEALMVGLKLCDKPLEHFFIKALKGENIREYQKSGRIMIEYFRRELRELFYNTSFNTVLLKGDDEFTHSLPAINVPKDMIPFVTDDHQGSREVIVMYYDQGRSRHYHLRAFDSHESQVVLEDIVTRHFGTIKGRTGYFSAPLQVWSH